jgi:chromate transport protein ChrA
MSSIVTILAVLALLALGILIILADMAHVSSTVKLIVGIVLIVIAVLFIFFLCCYRKRNSVISIFLDWSTEFVRHNCLSFLYIPIFLVLTAGLIALCMFQHLAYLSHSQPKAQEGDIYLKLPMNLPLFVLNIIEFIWGLQFLKDACKDSAT